MALVCTGCLRPVVWRNCISCGKPIVGVSAPCPTCYPGEVYPATKHPKCPEVDASLFTRDNS